LKADAQPSGTPNRRALAIARNDDEAKSEVGRLIGELGFVVVDIGPLSESWRIQPNTPGYGPRRTADQLRRDVAAAPRPLGTPRAK
jgi:predicted dinucleotide-binding enzyme